MVAMPRSTSIDYFNVTWIFQLTLRIFEQDVSIIEIRNTITKKTN